MPHVSYKQAGVDLDLYRQTMQKLPKLLRRTHTPRVLELSGGFAGLFRLNEDEGPAARRYADPVLISGADGVGTKVKVAAMSDRCNTVGIDLVAMCVNDCLCLGAEPLFFLDYLALGKDDPKLVEQLVEGVSEGCLQAGAALLGGETAIMPDLYAAGDFDMAGFCVGVAERNRIIDGTAIRAGDRIVGLASSGFHSNGYSLIRKVVFEAAGMDVHQHVPELGQTVAEVLLVPTIIYVRPVSAVLSKYGERAAVHGMAHITGGGLAENLERILPENRRAVVHAQSWETPAVFGWLETLGRLEREEMRRVFNMGLGFVMIVDAHAADEIAGLLADEGTAAWVIGEVIEGSHGVELGV